MVAKKTKKKKKKKFTTELVNDRSVARELVNIFRSRFFTTLTVMTVTGIQFLRQLFGK